MPLTVGLSSPVGNGSQVVGSRVSRIRRAASSDEEGKAKKKRRKPTKGNFRVDKAKRPKADNRYLAEDDGDDDAGAVRYSVTVCVYEFKY